MSRYSQQSHPTARGVPIGTIDPETEKVATGQLYGWLSLTEYVGVYPTIRPRFGENGAGGEPKDFLLLRHEYMCDGPKYKKVAPVGAPNVLYELAREGYPSSKYGFDQSLVDCLTYKDATLLDPGTICPISHFVASPDGWLPCDVYQRRFPTVEPRWYENGNTSCKLVPEVVKTAFIHESRTVTAGTLDPLTWHVATALRWEPIDIFMGHAVLGDVETDIILWGENGAPACPDSWPEIPTAWMDRVTGVLEGWVRPWAPLIDKELPSVEKRHYMGALLLNHAVIHADPVANPIACLVMRLRNLGVGAEEEAESSGSSEEEGGGSLAADEVQNVPEKGCSADGAVVPDAVLPDVKVTANVLSENNKAVGASKKGSPVAVPIRTSWPPIVEEFMREHKASPRVIQMALQKLNLTAGQLALILRPPKTSEGLRTREEWEEYLKRYQSLVDDLGVPEDAFSDIIPAVEAYMRNNGLDYAALLKMLDKWGVGIGDFPRLLSKGYEPVLEALEAGHITVQEYYRKLDQPLWFLPKYDWQGDPNLRVAKVGSDFKHVVARKSVGGAASSSKKRRSRKDVEWADSGSCDSDDVAHGEPVGVQGNGGSVGDPGGTGGQAVSQVLSDSGGADQLTLLTQEEEVFPDVATGGDEGSEGGAVTVGAAGDGGSEGSTVAVGAAGESEPEDVNRLISKLLILSYNAFSCGNVPDFAFCVSRVG